MVAPSQHYKQPRLKVFSVVMMKKEWNGVVGWFKNVNKHSQKHKQKRRKRSHLLVIGMMWT